MFQKPVHRVFEETVERVPHHIAIRSGGDILTYREVNSRANQLARHLIAKGVVPGTPVAVCLEPSLDIAVSALAILKAGGIYVPIDPGNPVQRATYMLSDSGSDILIAGQQHASRLSPPYRCFIDVHDSSFSDVLGAYSPSNLHGEGDWETPAYIIYTSGSTGVPKGVTAPHRSLLNRLSWGLQVFPYAAGDVCCQKTPISFVDSLAEIFSPLIGGCELFVFPAEAARDPSLLAALLQRHSVSRLVAVPSLIKELCTLLSSENRVLPGVRLLMSSGEILSASLVQSAHARLPRATVVNIYGSSEVGADVSYFVVPRDATFADTIPIGVPISNTSLDILDEDLKVVPDGETGELYVGGMGLAIGYHNRPGDTAAKFIRDPRCSEQGSRLYKTGDRARRLTDGNLDYCGRVDQQIKLRGVRIELGDIEASICLLPGIDAAVIVPEQIADDTHLTAYLKRSPRLPNDYVFDSADIRRRLRETLPDIMIPSQYVIVDEFPLTPSGKLDRQALSSPHERSILRHQHVPASTQIERYLADIWSDVLGIARDTIGIHDDFFALGGHSFKLLKLIFRISNRFNTSLDIAEFTRIPTIAASALTIARQQGDFVVTTPPICTTQCALSPPQIRLVNEHPLDAEQIRRHNIEFLVCVAGGRQQVHEVVTRCLERHDVFFLTHFLRQSNGLISQYFGKGLAAPPVDLTEKFENIELFIGDAKSHRSTLDLHNGPLYHIATYSARDGMVYIYGLINHLLIDGYSQQVLIGEVSNSLSDLQLRLPYSLSFGDRIGLLSSEAMRTQLESEKPYWERIVGHPANPSAFADRERNMPVDSLGVGTTWRSLAENWDNLAAYDLRTRSVILLASCLHSVGRHYGLDWITCRVVGSGRMMDGVNDALTVGYLSDHYPQRFEIGLTLLQTYENVRSEQANVPSSGAGYGWLRHVLRVPTLAAGFQIDDCLCHFNYLPHSDLGGSGVTDVTHLLGEPDPYLGDNEYQGIGFFVTEKADGLGVGLYCNSKYISRESVAEVLSQVVSSVRQLIALLKLREPD
ncbi:MAG: amino acid adenylation domain-containing protein [Bryobacteraceae bacterium]